MTPAELIATKDEIVKAAREAAEMSRVMGPAVWTAFAEHIGKVLAALPAAGQSPDLTNHHNAALCPYCNPKGLKFAESAPAGHETPPQKERK